MTANQNSPHYVYRYYDKDDRLLYVGCTHVPYMRHNNHSKNSEWFSEVVRKRHTVYTDKATALRKELEAIRNEKPMHNVRGRWDTGVSRDHWEVADYHSFLWASIGAVDPDKGVSGKTRAKIKGIAREAHDRFGVTLMRFAA